jgi:hypothetical protein
VRPLDRSLFREESLKILKTFLFALDFCIKNVKKAAWRKMERNFLVFANSRQEMLLNSIGQLMGTAERV